MTEDSIESLPKLKKNLRALFPRLRREIWRLSWKDDEDDDVQICTDVELKTAFKDMEAKTASDEGGKRVRKLNILVKGKKYKFLFRFKIGIHWVSIL